MEFLRKQKGQWALLILLLAGVFLYRELSRVDPGSITQSQVDLLVEEMSGHWYRIPDYPGSTAPDPVKEASSDRIIFERLQPSQATYEQARSFYDKELVDVGWQLIGEEDDVAGFESPAFLYRSGSYHMWMTTGKDGILLRMTWSATGDLLVDARIGK